MDAKYMKNIFSILKENNIDTLLHDKADKYITLNTDVIQAPVIAQLLFVGVKGIKAERGYLGKTHIVIELEDIENQESSTDLIGYENMDYTIGSNN